jgi:N6-adenosine-specific RNA methylase IME4
MIQPRPRGQFSAILADPPWPYATYSDKGKGRSAEAHYDVMSIDDIKAFGAYVQTVAGPDCVLFLWVTEPQLMRGEEVMHAWGFEYKTVGFVWAKTLPDRNPGQFGFAPEPKRFFMGMGHWTRSNPEHCLLGTHGSPHRANADVRELMVADIREHSVKPDEIYEAIERLLGPDGQYLELFASTTAVHRPNWTRWSGKDRAPERRWKSDSYPGG